jgi:hypothetical protein
MIIFQSGRISLLCILSQMDLATIMGQFNTSSNALLFVIGFPEFYPSLSGLYVVLTPDFNGALSSISST